MERLWKTLDRAGVPWAAFWVTMWMGGLYALKLFLGLLTGVTSIAPTAAKLTADIDAIHGTVLGVVLGGLGWLFSGGLLFIGIRFAALVLVCIVIAKVLFWYKELTLGSMNKSADILVDSLEATERVAKVVAREAVQQALEAARKHPAIGGAAQQSVSYGGRTGGGFFGAALSTPPMTPNDAWKAFGLNPDYAAGYNEKDVRRVYDVNAGVSDLAHVTKITDAWVVVCKQKGWQP